MSDNIVRKFVESLSKEQFEALRNLAVLPGGLESLADCVQGNPFLNPVPEPQSFGLQEKKEGNTGGGFVLERGIMGRRTQRKG